MKEDYNSLLIRRLYTHHSKKKNLYKINFLFDIMTIFYRILLDKENIIKSVNIIYDKIKST